MEKSKISIIVTVTATIILLIGIAAYKAEAKHRDRLYYAVHQKIKETAKDCYLKKICNDRIILKDLYEKMNLATMIDPITKEEMDENLCLEYLDEVVEFCK